MNPFLPEFEGEIALNALPDDFTARLRRRVEEGFLAPGTRSRANYVVDSSGPNEIVIRAEGFWTAYNIGLNEVHVSRSGPNTLRYRCSFWRWTRYATIHGTLMGAAFLAAYLLMPAVRNAVASYRQGEWIFWGFVGFFALAWPWFLTLIHRRFAERALQRILRETLG